MVQDNNRRMKDSGIPWIGMIPSDWEVCFTKQLMRNKSIKGFPDEQVLSLYRDYGVVPKNSRDDNHNVTSEDTATYKLVEVGDFVINKMKAWQGSMAISAYRGIISPAYYICRFTNESVNRRYIHYLLRNETYKTEYRRLSTGLRVGQWDLNIDDFLHIPAILPPLPTQQHIADFLDRKCAEIDELAALQETMIAELKRYKQSVITETVTKGLGPNVPMKDSGVEWIGEIPSAWRTIRLKFLCTIQTGNQDTQDAIADGEYPFYVRSPLVEHSNKFSFEGEGILMAGDGAGAGRVFHHVFGKYAVHQRVYRLANFTSIHSDYLFYFLSSLFCKEMDRGSAQSTVPSVRLPMLQNFCICISTTAEQRAIADYLDRKCAEIDELIAIKQQKIEALKEYKKSVIFEYVTGKKEVEG